MKAPDDEIPLELGARETFRELIYLLRRARRLWPRVVGTALAVAMLFAVRTTMKPPFFVSRVVLRLQEGEGERGTRPPPARELRGHVANVIFNKRELKSIADRFELERRAFATDVELAYANLRDNIEIEVWQNYFIDDYEVDNRTARVAISYSAPTPELALAIARALATTYIETEQRTRQRVAEEALGANEELVDEANEALAELEARLANTRRQLPKSASPARTMLEVTDLQRQLEAAQLSARNLEKRRTELEVQLGYERNQIGLHMEVVDAGRTQAERLARPVRVALMTLIVFALVLFGSSILFASFDERIRDSRDLRLLGLPLLGMLPAADSGAGQHPQNRRWLARRSTASKRHRGLIWPRRKY